MFRSLCVLLLAAIATSASAAELPAGTPVDAAYQAEFGKCDTSDVFEGVHFPILGKTGKIVWYGCKSDPSRLSRLDVIEKAGTHPKAIVFTSKIARDDDGSTKACGGSKGITDQCTTSLMLDATETTPCIIKSASGTQCVPVDSGKVPFVVIPAAAPKGMESNKFRRLTGVAVGDYGVVLYKGRTVPVIVADEGPAYKIGEGSAALLRLLSPAGLPETAASGVTFVLFPGSRDARKSLKPETLAQRVATQGAALFDALTQ